MSLFRPERRSTTPTDSLVEMIQRLVPFGVGPAVSDEQALTHTAVHQCVDLLADLVATFPADVYRNDAEDFPTLVTANRSIIDNPSREIDGMSWRRVVVVSWLLRGNAYGLVTGRANGVYPAGIELVHPDRVTAMKDRPDAPTQFFLDNKPMERWPNGNLWHAPGKVKNPGSPLGSSVLEYARQAVGLGLAARDFASQTFNSRGIPVAVLMNDKPVSEDGAKRVKQRFMDALGGTREPAVFGDGWKYQQISISPEESQFLATIKANKADVAGFFFPTPLIGDGESSLTYSNVEQRGIDLLRFAVGPWVARMDAVLTQMLIKPEFVRLNVDELLRSDMASRYSAKLDGIRGGFLSVNEVRRGEGYKPIPNGDQYLWPPYAVKDQATQADATTTGVVP